ncbi:MAG: hypothetical protein OXH09_18580 [Gammaproteobacteria bacterium]|nr:hypothetical protein [Gammaproteobacteria bacterium]
MLCKTTMRAALAHVLATVGILGAFGAGAAPDNPYASESLTGEPYSITATPMGEIVLDVEIDTLLESEDDFYLVVNFWTAKLTAAIPLSYTEVRADVDGASGSAVGATPVVKPTKPMIGDGTGFRFYEMFENRQGNPTVEPEVTAVNGEYITCGDSSAVGNTPVCTAAPTLVRAFRGDATDSAGVYKVELTADIPIDTRVRLALGKGALAVQGKGAATYYGDLYIYESLGDARVAARATAPSGAPDTHLVHGQMKLFEVRSKIAPPVVMPMLAVADVGYERTAQLDKNGDVVVSNGGPFRGFEAKGMTTANVGVLAQIDLESIEDTSAAPGMQGFLDADDGSDYDGNPNTGARVKVTAMAGAFGFGNGAGIDLPGPRGEAKITGDNPATPAVETDHTIHAGGAPTAFRIATTATCTGGSALRLSAPNADGNPMAINPLADNPTFSKQATEGNATVTGGGTFYFCVNVSENEVAIPEVGDDRDMDGYKISVTPLHGTSPGPAATNKNGGSIDRNAAISNITYLSLDPSYSQRLVIVNRSGREAGFWMEKFQTEEGTMIMGEIRGTVDAGSRMVIDVQNELMTNTGGQDRASGILNLTAPTDNVDIMTVQVHPGTGQIDTTVY